MADAVRVGCDVQNVAEVRAGLAEFGDAYVRRLLGPAERELADSLADAGAVARFLGGRFAAKEAVFKVLRGAPDAAVPWPQIEVLADAAGAPVVRLAEAAAALAAAAGIAEIAVSISHAEPFAFAVAVATACDGAGGAASAPPLPVE